MKTLALFLTTFILSPTFCPFIENVINDELKFEIIMPGDGYVEEEAYAIRPPTSNNVETIPFTMENYFYNLTQDFACNFNGSCGIVALSMILAYFELFEHNSVVEDYYFDSINFPIHVDNLSDIETLESPGIKNINHGTEFLNYHVDNMSYTPQEYINQFYTQYYDLFLIKQRNEILNTNSYSFSIHQNNIEYFLDVLYPNKFNVTYASDDLLSGNYSNLQEAQSSLEMQTNLFIAEIIEYIDQDIPVWLNISSDLILNSEGSVHSLYNHAVVAYDYEIIDSEIKLYCHFGYHNTSTYIVFNDYASYSLVRGYAAIIPTDDSINSYEHNSIYNYNDTTYCSCGEHNHAITKKYFSSTKHRVSCICGLSYLESHDINGRCCESWPNSNYN